LSNQSSTDSRDNGVVHIVDDELDILSVITTALLRDGYLVHSFNNASKALEDFDICNKKISIVITDLRLPGHTGFEIARKARAVKPDVPIILMTAFEINTSEFEKVFPSLTGVALLQKPFTIDILLDTIKRALLA
jgi:DNA-binding NtrC family response regulator